jgi:hypothetical protein
MNPRNEHVMFRSSQVVPMFGMAVVSLFLSRPAGAEEPKAKPAFTYKLMKKEWKIGDKPVFLCDQKQGFGILTGFSGNFAGNGEFLQVRVDDKKKWFLHGNAFTEAMAGRALMIENLAPRLFSPEHQVFEWLAGQKAVKMIAVDEGVCCISLIKGAFAGGGEKVQIEKRDDGYYWLTGQSQQEELGVQATALKWLPAQAKKLKTGEYRWQSGNEPVKIFPKSAGMCFVTSVGGSFAGYGEELSLDVDDQGMWTLSGRSQQESLQIGALGLRWDGK